MDDTDGHNRRHTRSARSNSASLLVPSTLSRAPNTLILSVSMARLRSINETDKAKTSEDNIQVFAIRILAFSRRFGQFTPMVLSRMKPN